MPDSTEGFDLNKPDPYDLYEKSRAIYESRRKCPAIFFTVFGASKFQLISLSGSYVNIYALGPEYEEVEVHLLREKTGFGFRILGGDEAVQAVSLDARDKARMGRAGSHAYLTSYTTNLILPPPNHI